METKNIENIEKYMEILWNHDVKNRQINFLRDSPQRQIFEERIRKEFQDQPQGFFLVYENKKVIGSLILKISFNPYRQQKYGDVRAIFLESQCRGKGYGTKLLDFADEFFKKNGCAYAFAGIATHNSASNALFAKSNYVHTRTILEKNYDET
ncbi:GNAT family N-acetyltransferase [Candidatus Woesearchaeota archaeon]|nr:GNAT family N-acetyltransferase [Candidatus Woesearchaeota archaeon]